MVSREEKARRAEEKERNEKSDANRKFWITTLIAVSFLLITIGALYVSIDQSDKLNYIDTRLEQLERYRLELSLEIENFDKRLDSIQTARIDTLGN